MTNNGQSDQDYLAQRLYEHDRTCAKCGKSISLADQLRGKCPKCGAFMLAGPITPDRARAMLSELQARRVTLGIEG